MKRVKLIFIVRMDEEDEEKLKEKTAELLVKLTRTVKDFEKDSYIGGGATFEELSRDQPTLEELK